VSCFTVCVVAALEALSARDSGRRDMNAILDQTEYDCSAALALIVRESRKQYVSGRFATGVC
jgi:hypothetical protein